MEEPKRLGTTDAPYLDRALDAAGAALDGMDPPATAMLLFVRDAAGGLSSASVQCDDGSDEDARKLHRGARKALVKMQARGIEPFPEPDGEEDGKATAMTVGVNALADAVAGRALGVVAVVAWEDGPVHPVGVLLAPPKDGHEEDAKRALMRAAGATIADAVGTFTVEVIGGSHTEREAVVSEAVRGAGQALSERARRVTLVIEWNDGGGSAHMAQFGGEVTPEETRRAVLRALHYLESFACAGGPRPPSRPADIHGVVRRGPRGRRRR